MRYVNKKCNGCKKVLSINNFTKNKNTKDGYSYYCKECSKKQHSLHKYKNGEIEDNEFVIIEEFKKQNIPIDRLDKQKVQNLRIRLIDFPGAIRPLMKDLPIFCKKYNLSYEEYRFFIDACCSNNFFIQAVNDNK